MLCSRCSRSSELTARFAFGCNGNTCAKGGACDAVARVGIDAIAGVAPEAGNVLAECARLAGITGTVVAVEGAEELRPDGQLAALGLRERCKLCA
mmetsp:Transcript_19439/g.38219  ORF Transcript_19439/g.38219 Transcript_19439/m.38219 type:complete len:95 (+) Transcript_19439:1123-1407(+)